MVAEPRTLEILLKPPEKKDWIVVGLLSAFLIFTLMAMQLDSWRVATNDLEDSAMSTIVEGDDVTKLGLSALTNDQSDWECTDEGDAMEFCDDRPESSTMEYQNCEYMADDDEWCSIENAGMVGQAFLWLGMIAGLAAVTLVLMNATGNYENRFGMIASFVAGGLVLVGVVIWMIVMPDLTDIGAFEDADISYGFGFFLAIISSLMALGAGGYRIVVDRN